MVKGTFELLKPDFETDKHGPRAFHVSNFLITMNTNARVAIDPDKLEAQVAPLGAMAEEMFSTEDTIRQFTQFGRMRASEKGRSFEIDPNIMWSDERVMDFQATATVEVGHNSRGSRLHLHIALKIRHKSLIRLDSVVMKEMANTILEERGFPLPIKYIHISIKPPTAEDYIGKSN